MLAEQLIGDYNGRKRRGHPPSQATPLPKRITTAHFPSKTTRGRCRECQKGFTVWFCPTCDKRLCHTGEPDTDCFLKFHGRFGTLKLPTCSTTYMYITSSFMDIILI